LEKNVLVQRDVVEVDTLTVTFPLDFLRPSRALGGKIPWEYLMENHREVVSFETELSQMIP